MVGKRQKVRGENHSIFKCTVRLWSRPAPHDTAAAFPQRSDVTCISTPETQNNSLARISGHVCVLVVMRDAYCVDIMYNIYI